MAKTTKKQTRDSHLTDLEKLGGVILLLIYLALIPLCGAAILNWAGGLLGFSIGPALRQTIWFYLLFAAVALVFHRFLFVCAGTFTGSAGRSFQTLGTALIFFYGLNEILFRVTHLLWGHTINLNDTALVSLDLLNAAPAATVLALVVLAPFIEEVLLRGFLFGWLRQHSRAQTLPHEEWQALPEEASPVTAEDRMMLEALLSVLEDQEREIVTLHALTGLKHREIAALLGLPLPTVLSKYSRALKKLRLAWKEAD